MFKAIKKKLVLFLSVAICLEGVSQIVNTPYKVQAAEQTLGLEQCKALGRANSKTITKTQSQIALKQVSYKQAVKSSQLKVKNKKTFRWSPLFGFKFPQPLTLEEQANVTIKPAQVQTTITGLQHKLGDAVYESNEAVANLYVKCYSYQAKIDFQTERLATLRETLDRNTARMQIGEASQKDVDSIQTNITTLESTIAENQRNYENTKKKLGDLMGMDITFGYRFSNPYLDSMIPREELDSLVAYTLENDQSYFEAKLATQQALLELNTNYNLLRNKYGSKAGDLNVYISKMRNGEKVDTNAFKQTYDNFLNAIDKPWNGSFRILFFKFDKEITKGEVDGSRYVEGEPYVVLEEVENCQDLRLQQEDVAKDIEQQVRDNFETLVSSKNAYEAMANQVEKDGNTLEAMRIQNKMGLCTFEEYTEFQSQYEQLQMDALESLEAYTSMLYSYNRLCCGGVEKYLKEKELGLNSSEDADSYVVDDTEQGPKYYIKSKVENQMFELGIYIPDDYETEVTHFEFWVDGEQIEGRTDIDKTITHLAFTKDNIEKAVIRLFKGDQFIAEAEIDPMTYQGPLDLKGHFKTKEAEGKKRVKIGEYSVTEGTNQMSSIKLKIDAKEKVSYYSISHSSENTLITKDLIPITEEFSYMNFIVSSFDKLKIQCYDSNREKLYDAYFETNSFTITKDEE